MTAAGSVSASGTAEANIPGTGVVTITETDYLGKSSGSQMVTGSSATVPAGNLLVVDGTLYANANGAFWSNAAGYSEAKSTLVAQKWVEISPNVSFYKKVAADITLPSLTKDIFHAQTYHKGAVRTIDGVPAIEITYMNSGYDPGRVTTYVALGGKHLPVSVTIGGVSFEFASWGVPRTIVAPSGSVMLATLLASSST